MTLIQEIRAKQVLKEENLNLPIKITHKETPKTIIGNKEFSLIFPKFMFSYNNLKLINFLFVGKKSHNRERFIMMFDDAKVIYSDRGRNQKTKEKDEDYFNLMSSAKFVLCPNGDFVWTYRFFEAIIFKAIPIIEDDCKLYEGYRYYKQGDNFIYREDWVEYNLKKLREEMTWQ